MARSTTERLAAMKKVSVVATVDAGLEDLEVSRQFGVQGVRRARAADDRGGGGPGRGADFDPSRRHHSPSRMNFTRARPEESITARKR